MPLALLQMIARCTCTHATRARRPGPPRLLKQHRTRCGTRRRRRARCGLCYPHTCRERCHRNCCGRCQKRCRIAGWSRPHSASTVRPPGPQTGGTNGSGRPPCGLWWAAHCGSVARLNAAAESFHLGQPRPSARAIWNWQLQFAKPHSHS